MNQSSVYHHIEIIVDWDHVVKHMWTWTPLMESFMSFSWPFQEHFDEISDRAIRKNAFIAPLQLLGKIQKKSIFIYIFGQMIEDQVLFHLSKFRKNIFSLRNFPDPLKWRDEAVPQGAGFGSLKSVWAHGRCPQSGHIYINYYLSIVSSPCW